MERQLGALANEINPAGGAHLLEHAMDLPCGFHWRKQQTNVYGIPHRVRGHVGPRVRIAAEQRALVRTRANHAGDFDRTAFDPSRNFLQHAHRRRARGDVKILMREIQPANDRSARQPRLDAKVFLARQRHQIARLEGALQMLSILEHRPRHQRAVRLLDPQSIATALMPHGVEHGQHPVDKGLVDFANLLLAARLRRRENR